ncbi:hypothetical protein SAMN05444358_10950 [Ruegeria halocynthiae]|uniref:Uncharacterized protein n=1 Tax=Ruegeria halocynthiae TaxID=985054 RepID=A0A1H3DQU2_9RHOB|nr:hypothetical protein [Ruegeria halocynthiae]SDX68883.1 hypothetical protein SAMN05444358_10950 [Ruegeria halocynthiae]
MTALVMATFPLMLILGIMSGCFLTKLLLGLVLPVELGEYTPPTVLLWSFLSVAIGVFTGLLPWYFGFNWFWTQVDFRFFIGAFPWVEHVWVAMSAPIWFGIYWAIKLQRNSGESA